MPLPRAVRRSLLLTTVNATLLMIPTLGRAADNIRTTAGFSSGRTQPVVLRPARLHFGNVAVGRQKVQIATITNWGSSDITLVQITCQGNDFSLSGLDLPLTLASGESFTFTAKFAPQFRGQRTGNISFSSTVSEGSTPILRSEMAGTGVESSRLHPDLAITDFGAWPVGSMARQEGTLTAGGTEVTISSATSSSPEFSLSGVSFPLTIPAWGSQRFSVTFAPRAEGVASTTLSFMDGSGSSRLAIKSLNGAGVAVHGHRVDLSWKPSTSKHVIGYNIYRANTSAGPFTKINSVLDPSTIYTDTSVHDGKTYYYATTAVNSKKEESRYSNKSHASIPCSSD